MEYDAVDEDEEDEYSNRYVDEDDEDEEDIIICPDCGYENDIEDDYCNSCDKALPKD